MSITGMARAAAARVRTEWARMPLRLKLVATLLLLVIVALVGSGAAAATTMRSYLLGRLDTQLESVSEHPTTGVAATDQNRGHDPTPGDGDGGRARLPSAYVLEVVDANGALKYGPTSELVNPSEPLPAFPHVTAAQSAADGTRTFTTRAVTGRARWRVLSKPVTLTDGTQGTLLVAQSLGDLEGTVDRLALLLLIIGSAAVAVFAGVGYLLVRASLRPLQQVEHTAAAIAAGDLAQRVPAVDTRTEVGRLSAALNTMLAEIETAFTERAASEAAARKSEEQMRRFVADASHELRTPLTSIRGFAELYRQGAAADDADVRRMMSRIEDEATRMGLLVDDMLLLARLDQERPLARAPVDLLALAGDAVHDARALDASRSITVEVGRTDPPPIVTGDEARLRQVLANLVGNAVQHTPPGTAVRVTVGSGRSRRTGDEVVLLDVADDGPGMTEDQTARVFERFYRADSARGRDGGAGLGLAIVAALIAAHGGSVDVETSAGRGTCFRVELPLATAPVATP